MDQTLSNIMKKNIINCKTSQNQLNYPVVLEHEQIPIYFSELNEDDDDDGEEEEVETSQNQLNYPVVLQHEQISIYFSELNEDDHDHDGEKEEEETSENQLNYPVVLQHEHISIYFSELNVDDDDDQKEEEETSQNQLNYPVVLQHEHISIYFSELNEDDHDHDDGEEEGNKLNFSREVVINERWKNHYSNRQKILLVGEGDFSFSNSLAMAFGSATNMIATSLDSEGFLTSNYGNAMSNIQNLQNRGCMVVHGVDATQMANYFWLMGLTFDRVVFNFPLAGFFQNESCSSQLSRHRTLIRMFLENAKEMIMDGGEIHITHKSNRFFREWNLESLASDCGLQLIEEEDFNFREYPGYRTKYGFGGDKNFNCNPSKTYKFGFAFGIPIIGWE